MSLSPVNNSNPSVLDLFAPVQAPSPRNEMAGAESSKRDSGSGFRDILRESEARNSQPVEDRGVEKTDNALPREASQPEQSTGEQTQASEQGDSRQESEGQQSQDQGDGEQAQESDESADASAQQSEQEQQAESTDAQAQSIRAAAQFAFAQQGGQSVNAQAAESANAESAAQGQQAQSASAQFGSDASALGKAQSQGTTVQATAASVVQQSLQQDTQAQTGSGDTGSDAKATTQASATSTAAGNTSASSAQFVLPDQANADSRLPVNPANTAQQAEAAKLTQAGLQLNASGDNDALNTSRITRGLANAVQQRGGAVTLRLTPPEMGTVRIQMQITGTNISASFHAESPSAQTLLTQQLSQLRSSLESKGMSVERLTVQPLASTSASPNANQNQSDTQQQNQGQQQNANDGRSRGQYSGGSSRDGSSGGDDSTDAQGNARQARRGFFDRLNDAADAA